MANTRVAMSAIAEETREGRKGLDIWTGWLQDW